MVSLIYIDIGDPQTPLQGRVEAAIKQMKVDVPHTRLTHALTKTVV